MSGELGFGTLLKMGATPTIIGGITGVSGPSYEMDTIDVTAHDSSTSYFREYIAGLRDAGEVTFDLNLDPDGTTHKHATGGVPYLLEEGTLEDFVIVFPDGSQVAFEGFVTSWEPDMPFDDKMSASATIKVSGKPTWTYS
ncbi:MAG: hypothetical protein KDE20_01075 [Caldilineaceae bacterium]|nr:hypothetical protein [Caldilineaceae bacterium]